jgi:hypothetical protein
MKRSTDVDVEGPARTEGLRWGEDCHRWAESARAEIVL